GTGGGPGGGRVVQRSSGALTAGEASDGPPTPGRGTTEGFRDAFATFRREACYSHYYLNRKPLEHPTHGAPDRTAGRCRWAVRLPRPRPGGPASRRRRPASAPEHGAGDEVGAERGEDGQVEQAGGGHHRRVVALPQRGPGHDDQDDRGHGAGDPEPAERAAV